MAAVISERVVFEFNTLLTNIPSTRVLSQLQSRTHRTCAPAKTNSQLLVTRYLRIIQVALNSSDDCEWIALCCYLAVSTSGVRDPPVRVDVSLGSVNMWSSWKPEKNLVLQGLHRLKLRTAQDEKALALTKARFGLVLKN